MTLTASQKWSTLGVLRAWSLQLRGLRILFTTRKEMNIWTSLLWKTIKEFHREITKTTIEPKATSITVKTTRSRNTRGRCKGKGKRSSRKLRLSIGHNPRSWTARMLSCKRRSWWAWALPTRTSILTYPRRKLLRLIKIISISLSSLGISIWILPSTGISKCRRRTRSKFETIREGELVWGSDQEN